MLAWKVVTENLLSPVASRKLSFQPGTTVDGGRHGVYVLPDLRTACELADRKQRRLLELDVDEDTIITNTPPDRLSTRAPRVRVVREIGVDEIHEILGEHVRPIETPVVYWHRVGARRAATLPPFLHRVLADHPDIDQQRAWRVARTAVDFHPFLKAADPQLAFLFALLHNAGHAKIRPYLETLQPVLDLEPGRLDTLVAAIDRHPHGTTTDESTIATCWDAARLHRNPIPHRLLLTEHAHRLDVQTQAATQPHGPEHKPDWRNLLKRTQRVVSNWLPPDYNKPHPGAHRLRLAHGKTVHHTYRAGQG